MEEQDERERIERGERVRRALALLGVKPIDKAPMREEIDRFWTQKILPRLSALHRRGRLPDLAGCPLWAEAERLWNTLAEGSEAPALVETIKEAMQGALHSYEKEIG
jgi:hypothetical protein